MNKKVSTIFAMAALMGGVFSGSAYAQNTGIDLTKSKVQVEVPNAAVLLEQNGYYLGIEVNGEIKNLTSENSSIPAEKKNYYLWTVKALDKTSADEKTKYTFTNAATGDILSFDLEEGQFIYGEGADDLKKAAYIFSFGTKSGATVQDAEYNYTTKAEDITQQLYTIADVKTPGDAVGTRLALNIQDTRLVFGYALVRRCFSCCIYFE